MRSRDDRTGAGPLGVLKPVIALIEAAQLEQRQIGCGCVGQPGDQPALGLVGTPLRQRDAGQGARL